MSQSSAKTIAVAVGTILFNLIFWNEKQGVNVLLFDLFISGMLFQFNTAAFKTRAVQAVAAGLFIVNMLIFWHNSVISIIIHILIFSILVGLAQQTQLRILMEHRAELLKKMPNQPFSENDYTNFSQPIFTSESAKADFIDEKIRRKRANFEVEQSTLSWLSWNYPDAQNKAYLKGK